jgi:NADPH:quinone reductase
MKALRFAKYGPPSVLTLDEIDRPKPAPDEALVEVRAAGINPSDVKNVAGAFEASLPRTPGRDYAGVVVEGEGWKGREVWGSVAGIVPQGTHAEFLVVPLDGLSEKPKSLSMEQASTVGIPYLAAWSSLVEAGRVEAGETVLITGALGAVGRAATQIAHWKKAKVLGADRVEAPSEADAFIDTGTKDLTEEARRLTGGKGVDLVLDCVGGPLFEPCLKSLRIGGRQVAITSAGKRRVAFDLLDFYHNLSRLIGVDTMKITAPEIAKAMDQLRAGFDDGHFAPFEIATWPLDRAFEAYEAVDKGATQAKQVLLPHGK